MLAVEGLPITRPPRDGAYDNTLRWLLYMGWQWRHFVDDSHRLHVGGMLSCSSAAFQTYLYACKLLRACRTENRTLYFSRNCSLHTNGNFQISAYHSLITYTMANGFMFNSHGPEISLLATPGLYKVAHKSKLLRNHQQIALKPVNDMIFSLQINVSIKKKYNVITWY